MWMVDGECSNGILERWKNGIMGVELMEKWEIR
jgi:hypothetical protein